MNILSREKENFLEPFKYYSFYESISVHICNPKCCLLYQPFECNINDTNECRGKNWSPTDVVELPHFLCYAHLVHKQTIIVVLQTIRYVFALRFRIKKYVLFFDSSDIFSYFLMTHTHT